MNLFHTCIAADSLGKNSRCATFKGDGPCIRWRNGLVDRTRLYIESPGINLKIEFCVLYCSTICYNTYGFNRSLKYLSLPSSYISLANGGSKKARSNSISWSLNSWCPSIWRAGCGIASKWKDSAALENFLEAYYGYNIQQIKFTEGYLFFLV